MWKESEYLIVLIKWAHSLTDVSLNQKNKWINALVVQQMFEQTPDDILITDWLFRYTNCLDVFFFRLFFSFVKWFVRIRLIMPVTLRAWNEIEIVFSWYRGNWQKNTSLLLYPAASVCLVFVVENQVVYYATLQIAPQLLQSNVLSASRRTHHQTF